MKRIYKYTIGPAAFGGYEQSLSLPKNLKIIKAGIQHQHLCLWCEVDPDADKEIHHFLVIGTGWDVPEGFEHIATDEYILGGDSLIWHVYRKVPA